MFKLLIHYSSGTEEDDEIFETEEEANDYGLDICNNYRSGGEILNLSNPGDYPLKYDNLDFDVIEV